VAVHQGIGYIEVTGNDLIRITVPCFCLGLIRYKKEELTVN